MKIRYEEMLPFEFEEAVKAEPVFFVPLGLLEWHAGHLPLGLDGLKAHGLCMEIAKTLGGGIVLPVNYFGRPGYSSYLGTMTFSEGLVNLALYELLYQLKKIGAKVIVIISGHYGDCQISCVKRAAESFSRENPDIGVIAQAEYENVFINGIVPADHAGLWESSIMCYLFPNLIDFSRINLNEPSPKRYNNPPNDYYKESSDWKWVNEVEKSSFDLGAKAVSCIVNTIVSKIRNLKGYIKHL